MAIRKCDDQVCNEIEMEFYAGALCLSKICDEIPKFIRTSLLDISQPSRITHFRLGHGSN
jgi:hypothetical protein